MNNDIPDDALYAEQEWTVRAKGTITRMYGEDVLVGKIRRICDNELLRVPNLGRLTLREIRDVLGPYTEQPDMTPTWITFVRQGLQCPRCNAIVIEVTHGSKLFIPTVCPACNYPNRREEK